MKGHPHSSTPQKGLSQCCSISYCFLDPLGQLEHRKHLNSMHTHTMILTISFIFVYSLKTLFSFFAFCPFLLKKKKYLRICNVECVLF